jgi:hypothetical protein
MHASGERFWARRLRWRFRGAWMWPAFVILTIGDGLLMHALPPQSTGVPLVPALIISSFGNLFLIGAVAPWIARRLEERQARAPAERRLPFEVMADRAGTVLLLAGLVGVLAAGLAARPAVITETDATEANAKAIRAYVLEHGSPEEQRNLQAADTVRLAEGYFRTCIPRGDGRLASCYFVDTTKKPPKLTHDPDARPNAKAISR